MSACGCPRSKILSVCWTGTFSLQTTCMFYLQDFYINYTKPCWLFQFKQIEISTNKLCCFPSSASHFKTTPSPLQPLNCPFVMQTKPAFIVNSSEQLDKLCRHRTNLLTVTSPHKWECGHLSLRTELHKTGLRDKDEERGGGTKRRCKI